MMRGRVTARNPTGEEGPSCRRRRRDGEQTDEGGGQPQGEGAPPQKANRPGGQVDKKRLPAVVGGEVDLQAPLEDVHRVQAVVGLVVVEAGGHLPQGREPQRGSQKQDEGPGKNERY